MSPPARPSDATFARRLLDAAGEGIVGLDLDGCLTFVNVAAARMSGRDPSELLGRSYDDIVRDATADRSECMLEGRGSPLRGDAVLARADGRSRPVEYTAAPTEEGGRVVGAVVIVREIAERARGDEAVRRSEAQLAEAQRLAGVGSWEFDMASTVVTWSDEMYQITGLDREQFTPTYEGFLATVHPGDVERVSGEVQRSLAERVPLAYDYRTVRPDGAIRFTTARAQVVVDDAGEVRAIGTVQDITERHAVDRMKSELISVVGHELRTPLTSIRGALGLLAGGVLGPLPAAGERLLGIAVENTARLGRLIDDILDIERLESGVATMRMQAVEAGRLIDDALHSVQATADAAGVVLSSSPSQIQAHADRDRIVQTLTHLLANAIKFSAPGATVRVGAERSAGEVVFSVTDEGRGIPADQLESVFDRFHQVDGSDTRARGGSGLGLTIARIIVQEHRGRIWVESQLGAGSTFSFALPVGDAAAA